MIEKQIIFLINQPLDERNYERFGISILNERGWKVIVLNFIPLLHKKIWESSPIVNTREYHENYFLITSKSQLSELLNKFKENLYYVDLIDNSRYEYYKLISSIHAFESYRILLYLGNIPTPTINFFTSRMLFKIFQQPMRAIGLIGDFFIRWKLLQVNNQYKSKLLVVVGGGLSFEKARKLVHRDWQIIKTHNLDYDIYLKIKDRPKEKGDPYFLFIDENLPFHVDFAYQGGRSPVTKENYYPLIKKVLLKIASSLLIKPKIALHPRTEDLVIEKKYYGNFPMYKYKTGELIKDCSFIVCHTSTSIQMAVLFNKPIIFVTTNELKCSTEGFIIEQYASELGTSSINLNDDFSCLNWADMLKIDMEKYELFRRKYIKMDESLEIPCWEIIENYLNKLRL